MTGFPSSTSQQSIFFDSLHNGNDWWDVGAELIWGASVIPLFCSTSVCLSPLSLCFSHSVFISPSPSLDISACVSPCYHFVHPVTCNCVLKVKSNAQEPRNRLTLKWRVIPLTWCVAPSQRDNVKGVIAHCYISAIVFFHNLFDCWPNAD